MNINSALDVLKRGERAIVLFTRGLYFDLNSGTNGEGWSGYWPIKPNGHLPLDKVIIYNRPGKQATTTAEIYVADYVDAEDAPAQWAGRTIVHFQDARQLGVSTRNWYEFAQKGQKSAVYVEKK